MNTGLLIPRLAPGIPLEFGGGVERRIVEELLDAKLLKLDDVADSLEDHIKAGLYRIPDLAKFEDMGSCLISDDGYGFTLYGPNYGTGNRIYLANIFADVWKVGDIGLYSWMAAVLNNHGLICGPEKMPAVVSSYAGSVGDWLQQEAADWPNRGADPGEYNEDAANEFAAPQWLRTTKPDADRQADLDRICPGLGAIFRELRHGGTLPKDVECNRGWAVCAWYQGCPVDHCWDYEMHLESEGAIGDSPDAFNFTYSTLEEVKAAFAAITATVEPITKLIEWKSQSTAPASPSDMLYSYTTTEERQLSLAMT